MKQQCSICGESKELSCFGVKKDTLDSRCQSCCSQSTRDWRKFSEAGKAWMEKPRKKKGRQVSAAKRARELRRSIKIYEAKVEQFKSKLSECEQAAQLKAEKRKAKHEAAVGVYLKRLSVPVSIKEEKRTKREIEIDNEILERRRNCA